MTSPDVDLAALFGPPLAGPSQQMRYRQGVVVSWDPLTASNTVRVGGTDLPDLPVLNTSEALLLAAGDVVAVVAIGSESGALTYAILGRMVVPGTPSAASALDVLTSRMHIATVPATESTASVPYTDLATYGPVVNDVPIKNGRALVFAAATINPTANENGLMNVEVSGATAVAPNSAQLGAQAYLVGQGPTDQVPVSAARPILVTGLNVGFHHFTAKYATSFGTNPVFFGNRTLIVFGL